MITSKNLQIIILALIFSLIIIAPGCRGESRAKVKKGEIYVSSEPSTGAEIILDGKKTGKETNTVLKKIKAGRHRLELKKENPDKPDLPFIGSAEFDLMPDQKLRVTIRLNVMAIQPRKGSPKSIIAETEGQKAVLDFYQAVNNKDYNTAYGFLSAKQKKGYFSYKNFVKYWQNVNKVTVNGLTVKKAADPANMSEIDTVGLEIVYNPPLPAKPGAPGPPPVAVQTIPTQPSKQEWNITTIGNPKDPGGVWLIDEIVKTE